MTLTQEQKKFVAWGGTIVGLFFFGPAFMRSCRNAQMQPQPVAVAPPKSPAVKAGEAFHQVAPSINETDPADASKALVAAGTFAGKWGGHVTLERQGMCTLTMEIRQQPDKSFLAFPAMGCLSMRPIVMPKDVKNFDPMQLIRKANPTTAVLSGSYDGGAIAFRVDRITGPNTEGCIWSSFVVTPFGSKQITAQWQDTCGGGSVLLDKQP